MSATTTARTTRRRTLRVALAALTAVAGLTLTACSGGADEASGTKSASHAATAQSGGAGATGAENAAKSGSAAKAETKSTGASTGVDKTVTLVDGSTAEITDLGNQNYRARIVNDGETLATLETNDTDAGAALNGMYVVLTMGGEVHSWMGGEQRGPGVVTLAGGWQAKITKLGELHYRAEIIGHEGSVDATLEADKNASAGLDANGIYIVLTAGGEISAHE